MKNGFTTIELLIAMQMTLLLAGFIYAAYFFSRQMSQGWQQKIAVENAALQCTNKLAQDILQATQILAAGETELVLNGHDGNRIVYRAEQHQLYRNQQSLNAGAVQIDSLVFHYACRDTAKEQRRPDGLIYFQPHNAREIAEIRLIQMELLVRDERKQMKVKSAVCPRKTRGNVFNLI